MKEVSLSFMLNAAGPDDFLTYEQRDSLNDLVVKGCRQPTRNRVFAMTSRPMVQWANHGRYERVTFDENGQASYCAGQDYRAEIAEVRRLLKALP